MGLLAILFFVLAVLMVIGLIMPKRILKFVKNPTRGKVLLFFGTPALILFIIVGVFAETALETALKEPERAHNLKLNAKNLKEVPTEVAQLSVLQALFLQNNEITTLPNFFLDMDSLRLINLMNNPISEIPAWLGQMKSLKDLDLDGTKIIAIPAGLEHLNISYKDTPLWKAENPEEIAKAEEEKANEDEHSESLSEFAVRQFLGKDYGLRRKFLKGEIYYNSPVTKEQADAVGEMMVTMGIFSEDKEVSMLLDKNNEQVYELKMIIDSDEVGEDPELLESLKVIRALVQTSAFPDEVMHLHLTDNQFDTEQIIKE
jgi:Leucine-rich repeat (LRR) protein